MAKKHFVDIDMNNNKITNLTSPSAGTDATNKTYVDNALLGINTPIGVKARTTGNITISTALNSGDSIDGVTLANGDLILVDSQTTPAEDGIYVVGAAPARWSGLAVGEDARGLIVAVEAGGAANGSKLHMQVANPAIIGTDGLTFIQFTNGTSYTADGQGIELTSTTFSLELDGTTLTKGASGLRIGSGAAGAGLTESSGVLAVGQGTGMIINADDAAVDVSLVARWKSTAGSGTGTAYTFNHALNNQWGIGQCIEIATEEVVDCDIKNDDANNCVFTFATSQTLSNFRFTYVG